MFSSNTEDSGSFCRRRFPSAPRFRAWAQRGGCCGLGTNTATHEVSTQVGFSALISVRDRDYLPISLSPTQRGDATRCGPSEVALRPPHPLRELRPRDGGERGPDSARGTRPGAATPASARRPYLLFVLPCGLRWRKDMVRGILGREGWRQSRAVRERRARGAEAGGEAEPERAVRERCRLPAQLLRISRRR